MDTALYFPYMGVPQSAWFSRVLLYWDQAATIVPESLHSNTSELAPYTMELVRADLVCLRSPDDAGVHLDSFEEAFQQLLQAHLANDDPSDGPPVFTRVHAGKMAYGIFHDLSTRGLTQPDSEWPWWLVRVDIADLYMAYLASVMSGSEPGTIPVTDTSTAIGPLIAVRDRSIDQRLSELRYEVITDCLPAPNGPVEPTELRRFKDKNAEALTRCRRYLDNELVDLATITEDFARQKKMDAVKQAVSDDVARLLEQMTKRRWPGVALCEIGGVVAAAMSTASAALAGGSALAVGLGVGAGVLGVGSASLNAAQVIQSPRFDTRAPFAYAAMVGRL